MGDPATPTPQERRDRRQLARDIIAAVTNDETMPLGLSVGIAPGNKRVVALAAVEELVFALAQELCLVRAELDDVDQGLDDWEWDGLLAEANQDQIDPAVIRGALRTIARIAKARKEARRE